MFERVRARLARARAEIDELAGRPLAERQTEDIRYAIGGMFEVVDVLQPAIGWQVGQISACQDGLAAPALTGKRLGELRDYGERIASQIMVPIAERQRLPVPSLEDANRSRGKRLELWQLTEPAYRMFGKTPRLEQAYADAGHQVFGQGLAMIDSMVAQERPSGHDSMTPAEFTNRYVSTLEPLERLRSAFLEEVIGHFEADRTHALRVLAVSISRSASALILRMRAAIACAAQMNPWQPWKAEHAGPA